MLTSTPELEQYITPGMGWEGKAVTSQDQDKVLQFLRSNLKPKERRRAMMQFAQSLDIPQEMLTGENPKTKETIVNYSKVKNKLKGLLMKTVREAAKSAAWQRKEGKSPSGGLNRKGIASYRRANPGSKLKMAVTTKPSKLKPGSKSANRRKSFCARMGGMKKRLTSAKTARDPNSRINKALRKWNC